MRSIERLARHTPLLMLLVWSAAACNKVPEPSAEQTADKQTAAETADSPGTAEAQANARSDDGATGGASSSSSQTSPAKATATPAGDPEEGDFTLEEALAGLPGKGAPLAEIETDMGSLKCELFADKAPIAVANFVGLARGTRAWKNPKGDWVKEPAYDNTTFHRIIKGFMIQGGDPEGTGKGGPGYVFKDEVWQGASHDRRGLMCMANRGPNTNGAQFFILDAPAPHLDRSYTIFGECKPESVIEKIAAVPVRGDRPLKPPVIKKIKVTRK